LIVNNVKEDLIQSVVGGAVLIVAGSLHAVKGVLARFSDDKTDKPVCYCEPCN